jgi:hypothetical protein
MGWPITLEDEDGLANNIRRYWECIARQALPCQPKGKEEREDYKLNEVENYRWSGEKDIKL